MLILPYNSLAKPLLFRRPPCLQVAIVSGHSVSEAVGQCFSILSNTLFVRNRGTAGRDVFKGDELDDHLDLVLSSPLV